MAIDLNFHNYSPKFAHPEILQHPQIPGPLSGMNPRTIFGKTWWDDTRHAAYRANNFFCHACGGSPDNDPYTNKLEAHECYEIDWKISQATYLETVALCHRCHNFIHAGRLRVLVEKGKRPVEKLIDVLNYGHDILQEQDPPLYPYWRTYVLYLEYVERVMPLTAVGRARDLRLVDPYSTFHAPDDLWTLMVYGVTYRRNTNGKVGPE